VSRSHRRRSTSRAGKEISTFGSFQADVELLASLSRKKFTDSMVNRSVVFYSVLCDRAGVPFLTHSVGRWRPGQSKLEKDSRQRDLSVPSRFATSVRLPSGVAELKVSKERLEVNAPEACWIE
jgi:hypothetical protein